MDLARKILNLRLDKKMAAGDLARRCGVSGSTMSKIERGRSMPREDLILRIASPLDVTAEYLLDERQPYPQQRTRAPLFLREK